MITIAVPYPTTAGLFYEAQRASRQFAYRSNEEVNGLLGGESLFDLGESG
jgi:hypothetical protein